MEKQFLGVRVEKGKELLGSENMVIAVDLKTIRGFENRILNSVSPKGKWVLYEYRNIYDKKSFKKIGEIIKR